MVHTLSRENAEQAPAQCENTDPSLFGVAVRVTLELNAKLAPQVVPPNWVQLIPAGVDTTVPGPVTVTPIPVEPLSVNIAPTLVLAPASTTQLPVPVHAPVHPAKVEPTEAKGVNVTWVPTA